MKRAIVMAALAAGIAGCGNPDHQVGEKPSEDAGTCANPCDCCAAGEVCFESRCCAPACAAKSCGSDGCGGTCGSCEAGWTCNAARGTCECESESDDAFCQRMDVECGRAAGKDRCGRDRAIDCDRCVAPKTCNVAASACECVPETPQLLCARLGQCGEVTAQDICGTERTIDCGGCPAGELCAAASHTCEICTPVGDEEFCTARGQACGTLTAQDDCSQQSRTADCGGCDPGFDCDASGQCATCALESDLAFCSRLGKTCGNVTDADNCRLTRTVACGSCPSPEFCDDTNHCHACIPETDAQFCARSNRTCGDLIATDNCGTPRLVEECGPCAAYDACVAGSCSLCIPETDLQLCGTWFKTCGAPTLTDSCGTARTVSSCGNCTAPAFCAPNQVCVHAGRPTNDACAGAERLTFDTTGSATASGSGTGASADTLGSCGGAGGDVVYAFTLSAPRHVSLAVTPSAPGEYAIYLRSSCDQSGTELGCAVGPGGTAPVGLAFRNLAAGTYFLWVDSTSGAPGDFTVTARAEIPRLVPANDSCAAPSPLVFSGTTATASGSTLDAADDATGSCGAMSGADVVYALTLASPSAVIATVSRDTTEPAYQPAVYIRSTCASTAASDEMACGLLVGNSAVAVAPDLPAGTYFIVVDGVAGTFGHFSLQVSTQAPATNDTCSSPVAIAIDPLNGHGDATGDTSAVRDDASGTCASGAGGGDLVYSFLVPAGGAQNVEVTVPSTSSATWYPVVSVRTTCDQLPTELGCSQASSMSATASVRLTRVPPGTYFVWVDSDRPAVGGPFALSVQLTAPGPAPANDDCRTPQQLTLGPTGAVSVNGTTVDAANDDRGSCSLGAALHSGGDVVYRVTLPASEVLLVQVARAAGSDFRPAVYLRSSCADPLSEVTCASADATGVARARRTNIAAGTYYVIVDGLSGTVGDFTLDIVTFDEMTNDTCATARALSFDSSGYAHARTDTCAATNGGEAGYCWLYPQGPYQSSAVGNDVIYSFTLTAASDVTATLAPGHSATSILQARTTCTDYAAEKGCHAEASGATNTLRLRNLPAGTYYLWVDADVATGCGIADLEVTATPAASLASNDKCAGATPIAVDTHTGIGTIHASTFDGENDGDGSCSRGSGPDLVYSFTLPQRSGVEVTLTPATGSALRPVLYLRSVCSDATSEISCRSANPAAPLRVTVPQLYGGTYYVVVDSYGMNNYSGEFDLQVTLVAPPPPAANDVCSGATPLTFDPLTNTATATGNTGDGLNDYRSYCELVTTYSTSMLGPDLVYSFTLPAAATVTATVTRDAANTTYKPEVSIRSSCAPTSEVVCATVPIPNPGSSAVSVALPVGTYYVFVDGIKTSTDGTEYGPFTLTVQQTPGSVVQGDGCANPLSLSFAADGTATVSGDTSTATQSGGSAGKDLVYMLTLSAEKTVKVTMGPSTGSTIRPQVYLRKVCADPISQIATAYASSGSATFTLNRVPAGVYYLWADSISATYNGAYDLRVELTDPLQPAPANDNCAGAQDIQLDPVSHGAHITGDTTWAANDYAGGCALAGYEPSQDLVYSLSLSRPTTLYYILNKDPAETQTERPLPYVRSNCTSSLPADELACASPAYPAGAIVKALQPGTYYLFADFQMNRTSKFWMDVVTRDTPPANDTCASAEPITLDSTGKGMVAGDTRGMTNDDRGTCANSVGPEVVYSLTLTATKDLTIDLSPGTLIPTIYVRSGVCSSGPELGCATTTSSAPLQIALLRQPAGTYYIFVDTTNATGMNPFVLRVQANDSPPAPAYDTCLAPSQLLFDVSGVATATGDTSVATDDYAGRCATASGPQNGPDLVYTFTLASPAAVSAKVTRGLRAAYNPVVYLRRSCASSAPGDELGCAGGTAATATAAQSLPAGTYYVVVDGQSASFGDFTLAVTQTTPAVVGDSCLDAVPLLFNGTVANFSGTTVGAGNSGDGSCRTGSTGDLVYYFSLAAESQVDVLLTPSTGSALRGTVYVRSDCADNAPANQLVCQTTTSANTPVSARLPRLGVGTYYLWVDTYSTYAGPFTGTVTAQPSPTVPVDDVCAGATPLTFDANNKATVTGETWFALDDGSGLCALGTGPDRVFSFTLSSDQKVTAKVTRDSTTPTYQPLVYLRSICTQSSEAAEMSCARAFSGIATATVNKLSAGTYYVWVDGTQTAATDTPGKFTLEVSLAAAVVGPANEICATAEALNFTGNVATVNGDTTLAQDDTSNQCSVVAAPDLVYKFTLASTQKVTASIVGGTGFSPALELRRSCGSIGYANILQCVPYSSSGTTLTVPALDAGTYYLWVDSTTSASKGTFALTVTLDTPMARPANDTCAGAIALTKGVVASGDTTNATNDYLDAPYSAACLAMSSYYAKGPDVVFSYAPATSGPFTVLVTPASTYDAQLIVMAGTCGLGTACIASVDQGGSGGVERTTVSGSAGVTYYLLVDHYTASAADSTKAGPFTIVVY